MRQPPVDNECSHCHGTGRVQHRAKLNTQAEAARAAGVSRSQIGNFIIGKTDLSFPVGLRLIAWLDQKEAELAND